MMGLAADIRHIVRSLMRRPSFSVAAILTLGLGIAGVISIVAIADMVLLRPLPYPKRDRLYAVSATIPGPDAKPAPYLLSTVEYVRVKSQITSLEDVEAMTPGEMALSTGSGPVTVRIGFASSGYLSLFGLDPPRGRPFTEAEQRDQTPVVVLDGGFWARQFGRDAGVLGSTILLDGRPFVVIGITEAGYQPQLQKLDAWIPLRAVVEPGRGGGPRNLIAAARLSPSASPERAAQELRTIEAPIAKEFPDTHARAALVFLDLHEALYGSYRPILLLLFCRGRGLAAHRLLERRQLDAGARRRAHVRGVPATLARRFSMARRSLSAHRERVSHAGRDRDRQPAVVVGGDVGARDRSRCAPIRRETRGQSRRGRRHGPRLPGHKRHCRTPAGVPCGTRLSAFRPRPRRHAPDRADGDRRLRDWLLGAQLMLAVILLGAASMIADAFRQLNTTDPGFDYARVLTLQLAAPARYPQPQQRAQFLARILERVEQIPGVVSAGSTQTNWRLNATVAAFVIVDGYTPSPGENVIANIRHVTPGYFRTLRPTIEEGRPFDERDTFGAPPAAIVSRSFAEKFWPGQRAIGRRIRRTTPNAPWLTIVGVTKDVMDNGLGATVGPTTFYPYFQQSPANARVTLVVRTSVDPASLAQDIQRAIWSVDPQQPIDGVEPLAAAISRSTAQPRLRAVVLAVFGAIGAILACLGVYGVAAYASSLRRREVSLRIALGADANRVRWLLVLQSITPVLIGAGTGVLCAALARTALWTWAGAVAAVLAMVALVATWIPAYRASNVSPLIALREE
jgi:putative ABC transport system permease protein